LRDNIRYERKILFGLINYEIKGKYCLRCRTEINHSSKFCDECTAEEECVYFRCLYHSPWKYFGGECTNNNPICNYNENVFKCFADYYLYLGRFGTNIKVGISRLGKGKNKFYRLVHQGLNEAIVIFPFRSLPAVTRYERFLIDEIGIKERITFEEKAYDLTHGYDENIEYYYSLKQIKELFDSKKVLHLQLYPDNPLNDIIGSMSDVAKKQDIDKLTGMIIYTQGNMGVLKVGNNLQLFDINKLIGREIVCE